MTNYRSSRMPALPPVLKTLIIINAIVYVIQLAVPAVTEWGALHYWRSPLFKPHQLITHMFMHDPTSFMHILFNMITLWMFGSTLETYWGAKRFLNFYLMCGIGAALVQMALIPYEISKVVANHPEIPLEDVQTYLTDGINHYSMIGASGAIMGLMAAFAWLFPNTEFFVFFIPVPVKAKYLIPVYVLIDLFGGLSRSSGDNIGHFAHLGGALVGILLVIFLNRNNRRDFY